MSSKKFAGISATTLLFLSTTLSLTGCGDVDEESGATEPGIYHGSVGSISSTSGYFSYARLFVATDGTGIFYAADNNEYALPAWAEERFTAFSFGANRASFDRSLLSFHIQADGFSYDSSTNTPNPRDSGLAIFTGKTTNAVDRYSVITASSVSGPGNIGRMENTFSLRRVGVDETISASLDTLATYRWQSIGRVETYGFNTNQRNVGDGWILSADNLGNLNVEVTEDATPSGCNVSQGSFAPIDPNRNEFAVSLALSCSDGALDGEYSGTGFLATTITLGAAYDLVFAIQDRATASKYLFFYGSGF